MSASDRETDENMLRVELYLNVSRLFSANLPCPVGAPPSMKMDYTAKGTESEHTGRNYC